MFANTSPQRDISEAAGIPPRVWLVVGDKLGDNAQAHIIAEALGWPFERKQLVFQEPYVLGKPRFTASLFHVDLKRSAALIPPWPDLIITVGRRPSMAALWVRQQSGGHTKIVLLGRPKRAFDEFALVIATRQYRLPRHRNVFHLDLPLMQVDEAAIAGAAVAWQPRLAHLPRPLIALFVGGPTKPFIMDAQVTRTLMTEAKHVTEDSGGTLYVTTSRRTPAAVVEVMREELPIGGIMYQWQPNGGDNPYRALLGLADRFIVTGDSVSMIVEVARLGKPLAVFPLPSDDGLMARLRQELARLLHPQADGGEGVLRPLGDVLYRLGLVGYSRDLTVLHNWLFSRGLAVRLGEPFPQGSRKAPNELGGVTARIKALMGCST